MQQVLQEQQTEQEWHAGSVLPDGAQTILTVAPDVEDARRRFVLALRSMTARKQRQERETAANRECMATLESDVAAYKQWPQTKLRRTLVGLSILAVILPSRHFR